METVLRPVYDNNSPVPSSFQQCMSIYDGLTVTEREAAIMTFALCTTLYKTGESFLFEDANYIAWWLWANGDGTYTVTTEL